MGYAVMGSAMASGPNRAVEAATKAISSPLLEDASINGARGILINITGSSSLMLQEVHAASSIIQQAAHEEANIIFGAVLDPTMKDQVKITVIATGFRPETVRPRRRVEEQPAPVAMPSAAARDNTVWQGITPANGGSISNPVRRDDLEVPAFLRMRDGHAR
jgi:cell division protein FtsZ